MRNKILYIFLLITFYCNPINAQKEIFYDFSVRHLSGHLFEFDQLYLEANDTLFFKRETYIDEIFDYSNYRSRKVIIGKEYGKEEFDNPGNLNLITLTMSTISLKEGKQIWTPIMYGTQLWKESNYPVKWVVIENSRAVINILQPVIKCQ